MKKMTAGFVKNSTECYLDNVSKLAIIRIQLNSLIKSGGGDGPVKPGNLHFLQGAKSGGIVSKDEEFFPAFRLCGAFFL